MKYLIVLFLCFAPLLNANLDTQSIAQVAKELHLYAGTKATIQWERVFSSQRRLKRYKIDTLEEATREKLKIYLIRHAADSEQPIVPGL